MDLRTAARILAALASEPRLAIFRTLVAAGPQGATAGVLARAAGIGPTALTFHVKELDRAGLVRSWRQGRYVRTAMEVEAMRQLLTFLAQDCCGGRPELCGGDIAGALACCPDAEDQQATTGSVGSVVL